MVTEKQVDSLPLNGRSIQNLVMLQPGMAQDVGQMGWLAPQWISNGNRGETEVATLDGADATDAEMGTVQFWNFNLDAIAEFKVQQGNYSAEYGQGGGTITQIVSKAGTNQFHGSAFEFIRNSAPGYPQLLQHHRAALPEKRVWSDHWRTDSEGKDLFLWRICGLPPVIGRAHRHIGTYSRRADRPGHHRFRPIPGSVELGTRLDLGKYPLPNQPNGTLWANT